MTDRVTIERLGRKGEGLAQTPDGRLAVPYALPGETVTVEREGERGVLIGLLHTSPERIAPVCPYFTRCGGCAVQTLAPTSYAGWKRSLLVSALARAGIDAGTMAAVRPLFDAHGAGRRRATLHARMRADGRMEVGYMRARAHTIIPIDVCPILAPQLGGAIAAAQAIATTLACVGKPLDISVTATETGLDVDLRGPGKLGEIERQSLIRTAIVHDLARLSNHGVIIIEQRRPLLLMGAATLETPPGAFLQATVAGEEALGARVTAALAGATHVADLFTGVGTFALRLAAHTDVTACDSEAAALEALAKASRTSPGVRSVTTERRDLFGRPLVARELAAFEAVVLDPPRAGAEAQVKTLVQSSVPTVALVACDVTTFARDAAILIAGGYQAEIIEPIDQFRYSPHIEIFSVFRRTPARKKRRLLG